MTRRLLMVLVAVLATLVVAAIPASAQTAPEFRLGFQTLAQLIPGVAGQPLENERHDPHTGDSVQATTTGMMVWRKATNTMAFTDGSTTWVMGPFGIQSRPNDARFEWEGASGPAAPAAPAGNVAVNAEFLRGADGVWVAQFSLRNPLDRAMQVEINVVALESANGRPIMDAPTIFLQSLPAQTARTVSVRVPLTADAGGWRWWVQTHPVLASNIVRLDVGAAVPLEIDWVLVGALEEMRRVSGGDELARVTAQSRVRVVSGNTPAGVLGAFFPDRNLVIVSSRLNGASAWARAAVLAHEFEHVAGAAAGNLPTDPVQCLRFEADAFSRQAEVWAQLWQNSLPAEVSGIHAELNNITRLAGHDPDAFAAQLIRLYGSDCGLVP
jgi:hypothetical protein